MLDLVKRIREEFLADTSLTSLVGERIYWAFKPVGNTSNDYPQVTLLVNDGETDSLFNEYAPELQVHIWTKGDARVTKAHEIAKRILINIDVAGFEGVGSEPCIYQIWKDKSVDMYEDDTQTFHKVIIFNVVMNGYSD